MKKVVAMVLGFLGITSFEEKEGKSILTEDQKLKLNKTFGADFTKKLETYLAEGQDETELDDAADSEAIAQLITGRKHRSIAAAADGSSG